jgi:phospholipid-binding lipoprotein MlaA
VVDVAATEPPATDASASASATVDAETATPAPDADATQAAPSQDAGSADAETDFDAIYGDAGASAPGVASTAAYDPWEKYNRRVHTFNSAVDRSLARPLAQAYVSAIPRPVRAGIGNFFDNLGEPVTVVNSLLQGNPRGAVNALGRFLLNSTVGIGGLIDVADKAKMPNRGEDFGQTMATWGWKRSRYIEVPFLGPRTLRDLFGLAADTPLRPIQYLEDDKTRVFLQGVQAVDLRARLLAIESLGEGAVDEYALFRDIWLQRRNYQINQSSHRKAKQADADLPAYLLEDGQDAPPQAMPSQDTPSAKPGGG